MKRIAATMLASFTLLAVPGIALASNSTSQQYGSNVQSVQNTTASRTPSSSPSSSAVSPASAAQATATTAAGTLPFTGLDIGFVAAGGIVLLGAGLLVRRLSADS